MSKTSHVVAVFGGAVAGSEAAERLASHGIHVIVFDQNKIPYGKIESGLPKWHVKLRNSQESKIDQKLKHPLVHYVPGVRLGTDLKLEELSSDWGFSAVLLATGAWRDRPLPIKGIDAYINKGLYYQNSFVSWFNHNHIPGSDQDQYDIPDDTMIIGGGMASFDVIKIVMIETARKALLKLGHNIDILTLEKKGIAQILQDLDISFEKLGLKGCTLYYRRRVLDMPLTVLPDNPDKKDYETAFRVRQKIFNNLHKKFLFKIKECYAPVDMIVENDRLTGLVFEQTEIKDGAVNVKPGSQTEVRTPLIISAIGSLPEPIPGMQMDRDVFKIEDQKTGKLAGYKNVFALGNAVTGRGNIKESQTHGRHVSERVIKDFLAWQPENYQELFDQEVANADEKVDQIIDHLDDEKLLSNNQMMHIFSQVKTQQEKVGYNGDYDNWIKNNLPLRLENLIS
jgi:ferredoxin/flavodoxin---NADP+ reductase